MQPKEIELPRNWCW